MKVSDAQVSLQGTVEIGTVVTVTCLNPTRHVLMGDREVTCKSTGWKTVTGKLPRCKNCGKFELIS